MGNNNFLKINDTVQFSLLAPDLVRIKDDYEGAFKQLDPTQRTHHTGMGTVGGNNPQTNQSVGGQGLLVRIAATHSGIITRNNGFYLPDKMQTGVSSFTTNYPKPILLHHNDEKDPIGRVAEAAYIDTSGSMLDQYDGLVVKNKQGKEIGTITETLMKDFISDKMPFGQQVDVVRSLLRDTVLADQSYEGLGHIQLVANITDREAIQKLLDGRYLTGSTGASTDAAVCSICRVDWTGESGRCEHTPGAMYDGAKCFIIAGKLTYDEFSFVNKPADRHAKVLELHYNGIQDSVEIQNQSNSRIYEVNLEFPQYETKDKEDIMDPKDTTNAPTTTEDPKPEVVVQDAVTDSDEGSTEVVEDTTQTEESTEVEVQDNNVSDETTTDEEAQEESIEDFVVRALDEEKTLTDEEQEKLYNLMWEEVKELEDAKLSTEKRNKLPKSTFCGPNRSFPAPDCAHVTAARRLIGRAKVSDDTKSRILACVNRKARAMGCGSSDDSIITTDNTIDCSQALQAVLTTLTEKEYKNTDNMSLNDEDQNTLQSVVQRMVSLVGRDAFVQTLYTEELAHDEQTLLDEVAKHEETIGDLRETLDATKTEYQLLFQDMETIQDALVQEKTKVRQGKENYLSTLVALHDNKVEERDWSNLDDTGIDSEIEKLSGEIDMTKIVDKLDNGMSREPTGEVDNPVEIQESVQKSKISEATLRDIEEKYWMIRLRDGAGAAESFLQNMKARGLLPQDNE